MSLIYTLFFAYYGDIYRLPAQLGHQLPAQLSYFMVGALFNYIKAPNWNSVLSGIIFLILSVICYLAPDNNILYQIAEPAMFGYMVMWIAGQKHLVLAIPKKIGDLSYSVYLLHYPVIKLVIEAGLFENSVVGTIIVVCTVLFLCYLAWHYIEKPALKFAKPKRAKQKLAEC